MAVEAPVPDDEITRCLAGEKLWGDDLDAAGIEAWHRDEKEAFARLVGRAGRRVPTYIYHGLNERHGFRFLRPGRIGRVLGFGSAWGDEFAPIADRIDELCIVDPSDAWERRCVHGIPTRWVAPVPSGALPFEGGSFDLVTCLGALHHIPNVSDVVRELARCLRPGGHLIVREPVVSMGDWRVPRTGLTRRERGIPLPLFRRIWSAAGLVPAHEALCAFPLTPRLRPLFGRHPYLDSRAVALDAFLSRVFAWKLRYHRETAWQKLCPTSVIAVLAKP
jgi:SAM-dependent methyltransferase